MLLLDGESEFTENGKEGMVVGGWVVMDGGKEEMDWESSTKSLQVVSVRNREGTGPQDATRVSLLFLMSRAHLSLYAAQLSAALH